MTKARHLHDASPNVKVLDMFVGGLCIPVASHGHMQPGWRDQHL